MSASPVARGGVGSLDVRGPGEPRAVRLLLIATALAFLVLFVCLPVVAVFAHALGKGVGAYARSLAEPDAWAALQRPSARSRGSRGRSARGRGRPRRRG